MMADNLGVSSKYGTDVGTDGKTVMKYTFPVVSQKRRCAIEEKSQPIGRRSLNGISSAENAAKSRWYAEILSSYY
jgi:hypothetical protein